jgi:hypothetical protein
LSAAVLNASKSITCVKVAIIIRIREIEVLGSTREQRFADSAYKRRQTIGHQSGIDVDEAMKRTQMSDANLG